MDIHIWFTSFVTTIQGLFFQNKIFINSIMMKIFRGNWDDEIYEEGAPCSKCSQYLGKTCNEQGLCASSSRSAPAEEKTNRQKKQSMKKINEESEKTFVKFVDNKTPHEDTDEAPEEISFDELEELPRDYEENKESNEMPTSEEEAPAEEAYEQLHELPYEELEEIPTDYEDYEVPYEKKRPVEEPSEELEEQTSAEETPEPEPLQEVSFEELDEAPSEYEDNGKPEEQTPNEESTEQPEQAEEFEEIPIEYENL